MKDYLGIRKRGKMISLRLGIPLKKKKEFVNRGT